MKSILGGLARDECERNYKLGKTLGKGSFAEVKIATHKADHSIWAAKIIKKESLDQDEKKNLDDEVAVLRRLDHPNIVRLRETFDTHRNFYMIMELCCGGELFDRIVEREHYTESQARQCLREVVEAIAYCHRNNIAHRDLKPENLLYSSESEDASIKVADFGLAVLLDENALTHTACGTPGYVAPEILRQEWYGIAVDIWSLGVIAYILMCGFPPFYDEDNATLYEHIKRGEYDYPSPFWDHVSESAKDLIDHMLVVNPRKRYTAEEVLAHPFLADDSIDHNIELPMFQNNLKKYNARRRFRNGLLALQVVNAFQGGKASRGAALAAALRKTAAEMEEKERAANAANAEGAAAAAAEA
eukprot:CAMPEP_0118880926 /NCGR_PEP_ID=MMETSP1163-20130328/20453_1 /TAXON_ID=124430 /ORGANISM="Phaeomonas parva, Strain CCMP2877" /LENGTH=358 /DNA_ID=CAMNT_0006817527 /DNA_START=148 /DNA_END=1221 /DNA_ORIENTATION=+